MKKRIFNWRRSYRSVRNGINLNEKLDINQSLKKKNFKRKARKRKECQI